MDNGADSYRCFLDGDDIGMTEIIRDYKDGLILFLNRYVHNIWTAEELAEDTFFCIVIKKPRFSGKYSFKTWLYTIGRNLAVNHIKRMGRVNSTDPEDLEQMAHDEKTLEQSYISGEERLLVHSALSRLRPEYGRILYLKFFEDLDNGQIARIMKKNRRQIENMLYQSKRALKTELDKEGYQYEGL